MKRRYTKSNITVYIDSGDKVEMVSAYTVKKPTVKTAQEAIERLGITGVKVLKVVTESQETIEITVDDDVLVNDYYNTGAVTIINKED